MVSVYAVFLVTPILIGWNLIVILICISLLGKNVDYSLTIYISKNIWLIHLSILLFGLFVLLVFNLLLYISWTFIHCWMTSWQSLSPILQTFSLLGCFFTMPFSLMQYHCQL